MAGENCRNNPLGFAQNFSAFVVTLSLYCENRLNGENRLDDFPQSHYNEKNRNGNFLEKGGVTALITVSEAMAICLEQEGVSVVFGYPGAAICPFYDALTAHVGIRHILVRTEQNAGHAANGYARMTGKPGVCVVTSGPGATNLITGISTAYMDSIPMVIITGQVVSSLLGRDVFQEADITGAVEPFIKHSYLVKDPTQIGRVFKEAFYIAGSGRPGPVLIDIPMDVQQMEIDFSYPDSVQIRSYKPSSMGHAGQIKRAVAAIAAAKRPLIVAGGGVLTDHAQQELLAFAQKGRLPIVYTMMGISAIPYDEPLRIGMIGMHGIAAANNAMRRSDLLILAGSRVGDRSVPVPEHVFANTKILHIDIDPAEIGKNVAATIPVVGDLRLILRQLTDSLESEASDVWLCDLEKQKADCRLDETPRSGAVNPRALVRSLCQKMPADGILSVDVGQNQIWAASGFAISNGRFLTSGGMGTMGYALPAGIGAKLAAPDRETVVICGDGGFQMSMMELGTAVQHQIPVKVIVFNNNRLGMVRELQKNKYDDRLTAIFLDGSPNFAKLAEAYDIPSMRICDNREIPGAVEALLAAEGQFLLEVIVDPEEPTL